jgi:hypothetical protein
MKIGWMTARLKLGLNAATDTMDSLDVRHGSVRPCNADGGEAYQNV